MWRRGLSWTMPACVLFLCMASPGCFVLTIVSTKKTEQDRTAVDVRVSSHQADVRGELCYVDKKMRVISKVSARDVNGLQLWGGAFLEGIVGLCMLAYEKFGYSAQTPPLPPGPYYGFIPLGDALIALTYIVIRDDSVSTSESWEQTSDTARCAR